jgi:hypothetical protein
VANSGQRCRWLCAGGADGGLFAAVLYWPLDMELTDMKQEDIIRMAQSVIEERGGSRMDDEEDLIAYSLQLAALVAAAEREACAKVVEDLSGQCWAYDHDTIAAAIRARGQA